uniref:Uncharacterized protein n=1 Tax=Eptatretus burgeri TaxID=7764 RepID=A0A8C4R3V4_EPTBU
MANSVQDPLAFFSAGNFSDSDEDSNGQEGRGSPTPRTEGGESGSGEVRSCSLPSPAEVLQTVRKPAFLRNPFAEGIDWSERLVKAPEEVNWGWEIYYIGVKHKLYRVYYNPWGRFIILG